MHDPAITAAGAPYPLQGLTEEGCRLFYKLLNAMPPDLYSAADTEALGNYVQLCVIQHKVIAETNEPDFQRIVVGERGMTINPTLRLLRQNALAISSLGARLGLDPVSRANISGAMFPPNKTSKFADLLFNNRPKEKEDAATDE